MQERLLVTGGAGFMGSYFIKYMVEKHPYIQITNLDALTYAGNLKNLAYLDKNDRYKFVQGDIGDMRLLESLVKDQSIQLIVNFAAESHVDNSIQDPLRAIRTNVMGVGSVLEIARKYGTQVIQISTDEVFGSILEGAFDEHSPFNPNSPYSAGKAGGDLLCRAYHETYNLPVIVTHSCNVVGPYQYPEKLIPLAITNILEGKKVPLYGDGLNIREWIYVEDHSRAIEYIIEHGGFGEVYNIGTGEEMTNLELIQELFEAMSLDREGRIEYIPDRLGHDRRYAIDSSKLRSIGWAPAFDFKTSLRKTIDWYQTNQPWWSELKKSI